MLFTRRTQTSVLAFATTVAVFSSVAFAAEEATPEWWGSVGTTVTLASDYTFRGVSQTQRNPAVQGSFDWTNPQGFKAGVWASNVDFDDGGDAHSEFDFYAGYTKEFGKFALDVAGLYYVYPGTDASRDYNYGEVSLTGSYAVTDEASVSLAGYYSPEFFADSGEAFYLHGGAEAPLVAGIMFEGGAGYQWIEENATYGSPDYWDWNAGVAYDLKGYVLRAQYVDTNLSEADCAGTNNCDARAVVSVSHSF